MSYLLIRIGLKIKSLFSEMLKQRQREQSKNRRVFPQVKSSNTLTAFTVEAHKDTSTVVPGPPTPEILRVCFLLWLQHY